MTMPLPLCALVFGLATAGPAFVRLHAAEEGLELLRQRVLEDAFVLQDFRAGKNSFVESPERHVGAWTNTGFRYTILDVHGQGSLRHLWTTRAGGEPFLDWEFYVDGETTPSVRGTDVDLVEAARRFEVPVAPANYLPVHNRAFNFYLPVPFDRRLRVDVVQRLPSFWLWFCQMDYRIDDPSLKGARLVSQGEGTNLTFSYLGLPSQRRQAPASSLPRATTALAATALRPGQSARLASLAGPGIVRELRLRWPTNASLRLRVRYDGASTFAVNTPLAPFFGPFQGVSFFRHSADEASCYLPMPFRERLELEVTNEGEREAAVGGQVEVERVPVFGSSWGYFHALHQRTERTDGHRPHQVLYVRGRGHWLGMALYHTGHDHGGGDFAVIDGEGDDPTFLHGINGEDYFTFAWFGKGAHHPYAVAHTNEEGRYRHHFENVYPFRRSLALEWGAFPDLSPESVAVWYQDTAEDTTVADGARADAVEWDVFGPVAIPHDAQGRPTAEAFAGLPSVADLDAGRTFECRLVKEKFVSGWMKEWSVGPMLNLTYVARHGAKVDPESELGGMGHAFLARRFLTVGRAQTLACLFAHDDPAEVWVNGARVFVGPAHATGFVPSSLALPLREGRNEIVVRLTSYFGRNFNWAGFLFRPAPAAE